MMDFVVTFAEIAVVSGLVYLPLHLWRSGGAVEKLMASLSVWVCCLVALYFIDKDRMFASVQGLLPIFFYFVFVHEFGRKDRDEAGKEKQKTD